MRRWIVALLFVVGVIACNQSAFADSPRIEVSSEGREVVVFYNLGGPFAFADGFESGNTSAWSTTVP